MKASGVLITLGACILTACNGMEGPPAAAPDARGATNAVARDAAPFLKRVPPADTRILSILHANNQEQVRLGQLALERAVSDEVRGFAELLVREHTESDAEVGRTAEAAGIALLRPRDIRDALAREKGETMPFNVERELGALRGPAFDQTFARRMVEAQRELVGIVERARPDVEHAEIRALVDRTLPLLRERLRGAVTLAGQ